jgi:hypothetical protein
MTKLTPKKFLKIVQTALADFLQATDELIAAIKANPDSPDKEYLLKRAEALKGDLVQAAAKEESCL